MPYGTTLHGFGAARHHWGWMLALGILLFILGLFATSAAITTTLLTVLVIGALLLVEGVFEIISAFRNSRYGDFGIHLFMGILDLVCGSLLIAYPTAGALTLTLILAIFFLAGGVMRAVSALMHNLPAGGWAVLSGLVDIILGFLLLTSWPASGLWFLGLAVGIGLIFRGAWWSAFALSARKLPELPSDRPGMV